ncbi:MAG: MaoC family dehydratase [Gemmatimonadetes bacterium]|nr:MaoC family dehydratase [Gemmatimonadota bacterium]
MPEGPSRGGPLAADEVARATLRDRVGEELGVSAWLPISQARIDAFAAATDDIEPLHNDPAWCATHSPYGRPIAHGFLTLSLLTHFLHDITAHAIAGDSARTGFPLNYGFDRVRFLAPVPVDSRIRCRVRLLAAEPRGTGEFFRFGVTVEVEGAGRPALVADWLSLWVSDPRAHERTDG